MYQIGVAVSERHVGVRLGPRSSHGIQDQRIGRIAHVAVEEEGVEEEVEEESRGVQILATTTGALITGKILGVGGKESVEAEEEEEDIAADQGEAVVAGKHLVTIETNTRDRAFIPHADLLRCCSFVRPHSLTLTFVL
mmetsp:Transcript_37045/g.59483  ORF Transcript_37045/g.59483 Transcript_37045/m.59483 type:complete len:138 (-) Transcript_37045:55-468(-)